MGLLSPFLLVSTAALAVPLWLHLRRKRRQTPVEFPSLRYLKMAAAKMKRQARVEDLSLLLLRLLLVALLAAAFARPVVSSHRGWFGTPRALNAVVVIDATASMGWRGATGTRLAAAKHLARQWLDGLDPTDAVALWVLTDRLQQPVPLPITDRQHWLRELDAIEPTEGAASLAPVFTAAHEWAASRGAGRKELVVISDNQPAAWDWPAAGFFRRTWQHANTGLVVLAPDTSRASNICVAGVAWDDRTAREGAMLTGMARLVNYGDAAANDVLECRIGGQVLLRKPVALTAGSSLEVPLTMPVPPMNSPVLAGEVALAGDALPGDDHWYFALPARRALKAMVVERSGDMAGSMRPAFFLTRALAAGGAGTAGVIDAAAWTPQSTTGLDSLWFTRGAVSDTNLWSQALLFADVGGTVVVTGDSQPEPLPPGWPVTAGEEISLPAGRIATRLLVPTHPLFAGVWNEQTPFPPVPQKSVRNCTVATGGKVLATLAGEFPLLVEMPHGKGRVLWLNASTDRSWGDLPLSQCFVPLVQQLARAKELAMHTASACWVGETMPDLTKFAGTPTWPAAPDGRPAERAWHSGIHDALANDGKTAWQCAVNVRRSESDLRPIDSQTLQAMLPGQLVTGTQGVQAWQQTSRHEVPLWPWLLAAAALVYLTEGRASARAATLRELTTGHITTPPSGLPTSARITARRAGR